MFELKPHQSRTLEALWARWDSGHRGPTAVTAPCGAGKTVIISELAKGAKRRNAKVIIYTNRVLLTEQTGRVFDEVGISFGYRASGFRPALLRDVQIASIHTERVRTHEDKRWEPHAADIAIVDEAHAQRGPKATEILKKHVDDGALLLGFTATPVNLWHLYSNLMVAATNSELRRCGMQVPCRTWGADEIDLAALRKVRKEERERVRGAAGDDQYYKTSDVRKVIHASVLDWMQRLNPDGEPTMLFAPGVQESRWFVDCMREQGITAAHIDAEAIYYGDGTERDSSPEERKRLFKASQDGNVQVLSHRLVLREGIDMPWLKHGIAATRFGSHAAYLQAGGRLMRSHESLTGVTLQDHGGNWQYGSLNEDVSWQVGCTTASMEQQRKLAEQGPEPRQMRCPACGKLKKAGQKVCPECGKTSAVDVRSVIQASGTLREILGTKRRRTAAVSEPQKIWNACYFGALNGRPKGDRSFLQVMSDYRRRSRGAAPPMGLERMPPKDHPYWALKIKDYESKRSTEQMP